MRTLITILFLVYSLIAQAQYSLIQIRTLHQKAYDSDEDAMFFADYMEQIEYDNNVVIDGYKAMSKVFMAKNGWNPYKKYTSFKEGTDLLDESVKRDQNNVELRFLRYTVQCNAPSFLGYSENIEADKKFIISNWPDISDMDLKNRIRNYMLGSENLSDQELSIFEKKIKQTNTASAG